MKRRITFTISVLHNDEHPFQIAEKVTCVPGYTVTSAARSDVYEGLIQIAITSIFDVKPEEERGPTSSRTWYDQTLRGAFSLVPDVRFVCVDSVRVVHGRTSLSKEISERLNAVLRGGHR